MTSSEGSSETQGRGRLFRRYFAFIGGSVTVVLGIAIAIETPLSYRETLDQVGELHLTEARSASRRVEQFLQSVETILRESAAVPWAHAAFTAADLRAEHHRLMKIIPALDSLQVVDATGAVRIAVSRRDLDRPPAARFENQALLNGARERGASVGPVAFSNGIEPVAALAVKAGNGEVIVAELNLRGVSDIVTQLLVGTQGQAFLVDAADRIVAHRDAARTLRDPSESALRQIRAARSRLGDKGVADPFRAGNADDVPVLTSAVGLPRWGWIVIAEEPLEVALAPVRATIYRLAALMVAGVLLALLVSGVLARRLSRPILSLREGTGRLMRGDLASRIDVKTGDEVEALARDFNAMAAQLEDYTTGLERKVEEKTAALREAMRARELFLAAASHDLRQPLYAISILGDALALKQLPPDAQEVLSKQRQAIGILRGLFDNLLDLSRFEAGDVHVSLRDISLREVLAPIAVEFEVLSQAKGLGWQCTLPEVSVRTDPELLRRLVANLLSNAVRYTLTGSVALSAAVEGADVVIRVSDTGIGIAKEDQQRVFLEFVQLENPARERERGVGLGLSIVRKVSELLGLELLLDSAPSSGTRVTFRLPVSVVAAPQPVESMAAASPVEFAGQRVWVVEDDPMVRSALGIQLDEWAIDHDFAVDRAGILALKESDGEWPAAVILDDMLGQGERGLEIATWLTEHFGSERIVLVTGNVEPARVQALAKSGFRVLRKPIASAVLAQALVEALRAAREAPAVAPGG